MKIAFIDLSGMDFDPLTPCHAPLGGMQSNICYLSIALMQKGHDITIFNGTHESRVVEGIHILNAEQNLKNARDFEFDIFISLYCDSEAIRPFIGNKPLILYTGHNKEEPTLQKLASEHEKNQWDRFVFKSNWQAETVRTRFSIDPHKVSIITNSISPFFEKIPKRTSFFFQDHRPPILYYSSTPFRGLEVLAKAFPFILNSFPDAQARIYSSMAPYHDLGDDDQYHGLYQLCRENGLEYIGSLSQPELAREVSSADVLAFPSIYAETSCITIMEAMANMSVIVSLPLGAVPETSAGFGHFLSIKSYMEVDQLAERYANYLIRVLEDHIQYPDIAASMLERQYDYCHTNYTLEKQALEWESLLLRCIAEQTNEHAASVQCNQIAVYNYVQSQEGHKLYINPKDGRAKRMLTRGGTFNPETLILWRAALDLAEWDIIIDVGANYGEMLFEPAISLCPHVLAIEPNPIVLPYLRKTLSDKSNIKIITAALSDDEREMQFVIDQDWSGRSRLSDSLGDVTVKTTTIDILVQDHIALPVHALNLLLKIDVEGAEPDILRGARNSINAAAEFCCLVEVSHLTELARNDLRRDFQIYALNLRNSSICRIETLSDLSSPAERYWTQDVILSRKDDRMPYSFHRREKCI